MVTFLFNMQKTTQQWLQELPDGYRELAIANARSSFVLRECCSLSDAINVAFLWVRTPEGHRFWQEICDRTEDTYPITEATLPNLTPEMVKRISTLNPHHLPEGTPVEVDFI